MSNFVECKECKAKSGAPTLCKSCGHNRQVIQELKMDRAEHMKTLELLLELFQSDLSYYAMRIAGGTIIEHKIASMKGTTVEGPEAMAWGEMRLEEMGFPTFEDEEDTP